MCTRSGTFLVFFEHCTSVHESCANSNQNFGVPPKPVGYTTGTGNPCGSCDGYHVGMGMGTALLTRAYCYASRQTYVEVNDTYSEGGAHEETLHPQSKAKVMNKRQRDKVTIRQIVDS